MRIRSSGCFCEHFAAIENKYEQNLPYYNFKVTCGQRFEIVEGENEQGQSKRLTSIVIPVCVFENVCCGPVCVASTAPLSV